MIQRRLLPPRARMPDMLTRRSRSLGPADFYYDSRDTTGNLRRKYNARAIRARELVASDRVNSIAHGVRWYDATTVLNELGPNPFPKMPPGHTFSELAQQSHPDVISVEVEEGVLPRVLRLAREEKANT